jgi:hypothetical protein
MIAGAPRSAQTGRNPPGRSRVRATSPREGYRLMNGKRTLLPGLLGLSLFATGCLVEVRTVSDPGPELARARAEVEDVARHPGTAKSVHVIAYDPDERKLVKVDVPLWLVHKFKDEDDEIDLGHEIGGRASDHLKKVCLRDLEKVGRGALVEVLDDDGTQVLVWLR